MRILVTRPAEEAARTAETLSRLGHEAIIAPVIEIKPLRAEIPQRSYRAVLTTSANAVRGLGRHPAIGTLRELPLFAVGDASAHAAREAGFADVVSAGGAADDLVKLVRARLDPASGPVLYLSGQEVASDLSTILARDGREVVRVLTYRAKPVPVLPAAATTALRRGEVDAVLAYSPRSARLIGALCTRAGFAEKVTSLAWICLSPAVAEAAWKWGAYRITVAERPDEEALLHSLESADLATAPPKRV